MTFFLRRARKYRLVLVGATSLVLVAGLTVAARASTGESRGNYRTAHVAIGTVTETITSSGTVDATQRRDIATAVDGTVQQIAVATGDIVEAGDLLVALDRTDAERAVRKAQASLAQAKAALENAENSQQEAVQAASEPTTSADGFQPHSAGSDLSPEPAPDPTPGPEHKPGPSDEQDKVTLPAVELPTLDELRALQDAVTTAQTAASTALAEAGGALDTQVTACANAYGAESALPNHDANDACSAALAAVQAAQQLVSEKQTDLQTAINELTQALLAALEKTSAGVSALKAWIDEQVNRTGGGDDANQAGQSSTAGAAPTSTAAQTTSAQPRSSAMIAASSALSVAQAQASIDTAQAELLRAEQELAATRIVAGTSGTIAAINVAEGDAVALRDIVVTVIGNGGATVSLSLDATKVRKVVAGQVARVTLPGATESVPAEVTWVSPVASSGSTSFTAFARNNTYTAEVQVPGDALTDRILPQGARADVTIIVGSSEDTLTLPTSAIITQTNGTTVRVLGEDGLETKTVEIGRTSPSLTEIRNGLKTGDTVVLADLDAEVDAAGEINTNTNNFRGPGGRGFPGGGPPAGFNGGRGGR